MSYLICVLFVSFIRINSCLFKYLFVFKFRVANYCLVHFIIIFTFISLCFSFYFIILSFHFSLNFIGLKSPFFSYFKAHYRGPTISKVLAQNKPRGPAPDRPTKLAQLHVKHKSNEQPNLTFSCRDSSCYTLAFSRSRHSPRQKRLPCSLMHH